MGSKNRIAKYILPIMLKERKEGQWWVEPFVGGGNIIDKVLGKRIGGDIDRNAIEALIAIRDFVNDLPKNNKEFTEEDYKNLDNSDFPYKGFAYFAYSYAGRFKGGWCRDKLSKRDYVKEAYRNALKQSQYLKDVLFHNLSYLQLPFPPKSIIYCDPPYKGATKYKDNFDHDIFF